MFNVSPLATNRSGEAISGNSVDGVVVLGAGGVELAIRAIIITNCDDPIRLVMESVQLRIVPARTVELGTNHCNPLVELMPMAMNCCEAFGLKM